MKESSLYGLVDHDPRQLAEEYGNDYHVQLLISQSITYDLGQRRQITYLSQSMMLVNDILLHYSPFEPVDKHRVNVVSFQPTQIKGPTSLLLKQLQSIGVEVVNTLDIIVHVFRLAGDVLVEMYLLYGTSHALIVAKSFSHQNLLHLQNLLPLHKLNHSALSATTRTR